MQSRAEEIYRAKMQLQMQSGVSTTRGAHGVGGGGGGGEGGGVGGGDDGVSGGGVSGGGVSGVGVSGGGVNGDGQYESLLSVYDFTELAALGVGVADFRDLLVEGRILQTHPPPDHARTSSVASVSDPADPSPLAPLRCTAGSRYTAQSVKDLLRPLHETPVLRLGSTYFLKLDVLGLQRSSTCFAAVAAATLRLPFVPGLQRCHWSLLSATECH